MDQGPIRHSRVDQTDIDEQVNQELHKATPSLASIGIMLATALVAAFVIGYLTAPLGDGTTTVATRNPIGAPGPMPNTQP